MTGIMDAVLGSWAANVTGDWTITEGTGETPIADARCMFDMTCGGSAFDGLAV